MTENIHYEKLTWTEVNEAVKENKIILLPVGSIEDHARHLPLDTDSFIVTEICKHVATSFHGKILVMPTVVYGYHPYRMDFPGGITISWEVFTKLLEEITLCLAHHGFKKILLINGHGSNHPLVQIATRRVILEYPDVQCAMLSLWEIEEFQDAFREVRESEYPGGASHAGEVETSIYLALASENVKMAEATKDISFPKSKYFYTDLASEKSPKTSTPVKMMEWWSTLSKTGAIGDPTKATKGKGIILLDAMEEGLRKIITDFKDRPVREIKDKHIHKVDAPSFYRYPKKQIQHPIKIGYISPEMESSDVYRIPMEFMYKAIADAKKVNLEINISCKSSPSHDHKYQVQSIKRLIQLGIDALIIHPADLKPLKPIIQRAIESGIYVVLVNLLKTEEYADLNITSYIGFDNYISGQLSAYATVDYLGGPGSLGRNKTESPPVDLYLDIDWYKSLYSPKHDIEVAGNVVIIEGIPGSFTSTERLKGFRDVIDDFPSIVLKGIYPGYWSPKKASEITEKILNEYPEGEVDVIWVACNDMAFGVIEILEKNGRLNQERQPDAQGIAVITNDGTPKSLKMIEQGKIIAETWHGFPEWGWHGVEFATKAVRGQSVPAIFDIIPRIEFSGNIAQFFPSPKLSEILWRES